MFMILNIPLAIILALLPFTFALLSEGPSPLHHHQNPLQSSPHSTYQTFHIPAYPEYTVRIKQQHDDICDARSAQYSGWLDIPGKHLFFWYIESMNDPLNDPLNLWITGGPGCSGMIGMLLELGPCLINENGTGTHHNPYGWTRNASMIFIDQPAGTGFSYVDNGTVLPDNSFTAAKDMYIFLQIFFSEVFPEKRNVPFHISGESYGGHYIPTLAAEILSQDNGRSSDVKIPLKSILIGNGLVSPLDTTYGYYETLCTTRPGVPTPVFNETRCRLISEALPRCLYLHEACYAYPDEILCKAADEFCFTKIRQLFHGESHAGGRDPFDITRTCEVDLFCYSSVLDIEHYMNSPTVINALSVPREAGYFSIMSTAIHDIFLQGNDGYVNVMSQIQYVLENGVDVLIYNGNLDLACNTAGNLRWANALRWNGQAAFNAQDMRPWSAAINGTRLRAGMYKEAYAFTGGSEYKKQRFAFVNFDEAGHMVPYNQPVASLHMLQTWLSGSSFEA